MRSIEESLKSEQCRRILNCLENGEKSTDELVKLTKLTNGSITKHVNVLISAGLVEPTETSYRLTRR
ncbi:MAG: Bacterial regulatory protein arsR family [Actinomycetota bacterium]|jgi:predicted transcriptional regulator